jgi:gluconate 2-dehydrogenase gamma chain
LAQWSRRKFLQVAGAATGAGLLGSRLPAWAAGGGGFLTAPEVTTLDAALARMIPPSGAGDWSAADLGVATYIDNLLSSFGEGSPPAVFAGGPYRTASNDGPGFYTFQQLSRVKAIGWQKQVQQWQQLYRFGLAALDKTAGGNFAAVPAPVQDAILEELDMSGDAFFAVLYDHTMEGTYSHPVYGGNAGYRAWKSVGFAGDVHGVRFPTVGSQGAWNIYGGYSPEEIVAVGSAATEQPVTTGRLA